MNVFAQMAEVDPVEADVRVDLTGMEKTEAIQKLKSVVGLCVRQATPSLYVTFAPARPGGGETLFQPLARYFRTEKRKGRILSALPVMTAKAGGLLVKFKVRQGSGI